MSNKDNHYQNLVKLLKVFQNRPNHLAKYLIDNLAFNDLFLKLLSESERLSELDNNSLPNFKDYEEMNDYYNIFDDSYKSKRKSPEKIIKELSLKLEECLRLEKYEDAIRIRDYITKLSKKENE